MCPCAGQLDSGEQGKGSFQELDQLQACVLHQTRSKSPLSQAAFLHPRQGVHLHEDPEMWAMCRWAESSKLGKESFQELDSNSFVLLLLHQQPAPCSTEELMCDWCAGQPRAASWAREASRSWTSCRLCAPFCKFTGRAATPGDIPALLQQALQVPPSALSTSQPVPDCHERAASLWGVCWCM